MGGADPLADPKKLIPRVYAYVAYRVGHGAAAEDLTSETFERALRYRSSYDPGRAEPLTWLLGIARRRIADAAAAPSCEPLDADTRSAAGHPWGERDLAEDALRRLLVREAVSCLSPRDRELIALRYGADLTAAQIAGLVEMKPNAVEVALHRALGRLRGLLSDAQPNATIAPRKGSPRSGGTQPEKVKPRQRTSQGWT